MTSHSKNLNAERLQQLSDEVSRIAGTLAQLTMETRVGGPQPDARSKLPQVSAEAVRAVIRARRKRARYFPGELFADPAWDMMLDLLEAEISHRRVSVSSLCIAADVPATTGLRWLKAMTDQRLLIRRPDPRDSRRVFVELSEETSSALRQYFAEVGVRAGV